MGWKQLPLQSKKKESLKNSGQLLFKYTPTMGSCYLIGNLSYFGQLWRKKVPSSYNVCPDFAFLCKIQVYSLKDSFQLFKIAFMSILPLTQQDIFSSWEVPQHTAWGRLWVRPRMQGKPSWVPGKEQAFFKMTVWGGKRDSGLRL